MYFSKIKRMSLRSQGILGYLENQLFLRGKCLSISFNVF